MLSLCAFSQLHDPTPPSVVEIMLLQCLGSQVERQFTFLDVVFIPQAVVLTYSSVVLSEVHAFMCGICTRAHQGLEAHEL